MAINMERPALNLEGFDVSRQDDLVAITTPIPDELGNVSSKTPVFHLPIYKLRLTSDLNGPNQADAQSGDGQGQVEFHCDLADLTDLIGKLKLLSSQWARSKANP